MRGAVSMGGNSITDLAAPRQEHDAANKAYTDASVAGEAAERSREIGVERSRVDLLAALPEGSTAGDAELADIRVGVDGQTYASAGDAVRTQLQNLAAQDAALLAAQDVQQETLEYLYQEVTSGSPVFEDADFHNGASSGTTTAIVNGDSGHFKCLQLPVGQYPAGLIARYPGHLHPMALYTLFDANGARLKSLGWTRVPDGAPLPYHPNQLSAANADCAIVGISFAFSSTEDISGLVRFPDVSLRLITQNRSTLRRRLVIVDQTGTGDYTSVAEAVASEPENTVILIKPGIYDGTIEAFEKRIILMGTDRNTCILRSTDGRYEYPVVNGSCGYFENLTLYHQYIAGKSHEIDDATSGGYAFHCEKEYGVGNTLEFHHCTLKSDFFPALGAGLRKNFQLILDDCILENNQITGRGNYSTADNSVTGSSLGALYVHDSNGVQGKQYITVKNCVLKSALGNSLCLYTAKGGENQVYCTFLSNILHDRINGFSNNIFFRNDPFGPEGNFIHELCWGNSNPALNMK